MTAPLLDGIGAGLTVVGGGVVVMNDQMNGGSRLVPLVVSGTGLIALLLYSANVGTNHVDACRELKEKEARRRARLLREGRPAAGRSSDTALPTSLAVPQAEPPPISPSTNAPGEPSGPPPNRPPEPVSPASPPSVPQKADPE